MRIAVLNGPNLNLLGTREPAVYGSTTLAEIEARLTDIAAELGVELVCAQFNHEGDCLDAIHALGGQPSAPGVAPAFRQKADAALVNAGAWTHTSLALRDALALIDVRVLDHVIVSPGQSLSMAEQGLL